MGVKAAVVINCWDLGLLFLVSVVLGVSRGELLGQIWVQCGCRRMLLCLPRLDSPTVKRITKGLDMEFLQLVLGWR